MYLSAIHPLAFSEVVKSLQRYNLCAPFRIEVPPTFTGDSSPERFIETFATVGEGAYDDITQVAVSSAFNVFYQSKLISDYNSLDNSKPQHPGIRFMGRDFPSFYATVLERLVYPRVRVACFTENPSNASMWGTYGDSHQSVCLKFRTEETNGRPGLRLTMIEGDADDGRASRGARPFFFEKVTYGQERPAINFFGSLGLLPYPTMNDWVRDSTGKLSPIVREIEDGVEDWRSRYWKNFHISAALKTLEWQHEREHRLTLSSLLSPDIPDEQSKGVYDFSSLTGLIFGARMPENKKLDIMKVMERKCRAAGRSEFEFHQARYINRGSELAIVPLRLLKLAG